MYLRGLEPKDVTESYAGWLNDPDISQHLEVRYYPQTIAGIEQFRSSKDGNRNDFLLGICLIDDDRHVGNVRLGPINWVHRFADVGIVVGDKQIWGQGIGTETVTLICQIAYQRLNLRKIYAGCYGSNVGSKRVFEKAGFEVGAVLTNKFLLGGTTDDHVIFQRELGGEEGGS